MHMILIFFVNLTSGTILPNNSKHKTNFKSIWFNLYDQLANSSYHFLASPYVDPLIFYNSMTSHSNSLHDCVWKYLP